MLLARHIGKCPYCGSRDIIIDYSKGVIVCRNCGTVIDDTIYDYTVINAWTRRDRRTKTNVEKRYTITEAEFINFNFNRLIISTRLSKKLRENNPRYLAILSSILLHEDDLLKNECITSLVRRLNGDLKIAAVEIAKSIRQGDYPLVSYYSYKYKVSKNKIKRIIKNILKCIG